MKKGYVYLIHYEKDLYKIGKSANLNQRLYMLGLKSRCALTAIWWLRVKDMVSCEWYLHQQYLKKRIYNELFRLTQEDVESIMAIQNEGPGALDEVAFSKWMFSPMGERVYRENHFPRR